MKLAPIPTHEYLAEQVRKVRSFVVSAESVEQQIDHLEAVIAGCVASSGVQSPSANNLTASLLEQLRFSTSAMFLTSEDLRNKPCADGYEIPTIL